MDNPKKQDDEKQNKNTTQYVLDTTMRKQNTTNVNKTYALLQTTRGKDEPNIVFISTIK